MTATTLPPGPSTPRWAQGAYSLIRPHRGLPRMRERYGDAFTVNIPIFGRALVISDPAEIKQLFQASSADIENVEPNLGRVMGQRSMFALTGREHRRHRRLLMPPFHGRRLSAYEAIVAEEAERELASWPAGEEFAVQQSMMRLTLNIILRAVFGAEGAELERLRDLLPRLVALGSRLAVIPVPQVDLGRWSPWGRFWRMRREYDDVVGRLIDRALAEGGLDEREDVLALMLQSSYDDGTGMTRAEVSDQLLTLLAAGHETTATTLSWAVERLRRHPRVLRDLVDEADAGGSELREATILEVQRARPVIDVVGRKVRAEAFELGRWVVPRDYTVVVSILLAHRDGELFGDPEEFDPHRFVGGKPDLFQWIPYGGGSRRCLGAAFAHLEMNVVLRTLLRDLALQPTSEPGERWHSRGVASAPARGGRAVVRPRSPAPVAA